MTSVSEKIIKPKLGLLELSKQLGNVSQACKVMGYSRDSFYRFKTLYENGGEEALHDMSKKKPNEKNRVPLHVEEAVIALAIENPALGQARAANELLARGIIVSSSGVRSVWLRIAFAKLYTEKTAMTAAHLLNERVLPWFNEQGIRLLRMLTDRGTEYCGKIENHAYQLYLAVEDIDHSKTRARSPQTNGICERFHKTIKQEFYDVAFRKKIYRSLEELQQDVDAWIKTYNEVRPHSGERCYGKTPMQTFLDAKHLAQEKELDKLCKTIPSVSADELNKAHSNHDTQLVEE
ncbi:integrase core domain-containing protein [Candidiatus Paracoxiella cheracis]|uniref:integrase core domain-containing protein n=1 Tax=Candidiatus Paracoxiella cheracis TaxID=3405120 RepID=UPI003BF5913B